jgi:hypothetical protein
MLPPDAGIFAGPKPKLLLTDSTEELIRVLAGHASGRTEALIGKLKENKLGKTRGKALQSAFCFGATQVRLCRSYELVVATVLTIQFIFPHIPSLYNSYSY